MIFNICSLCVVVVLFDTINALSYARFRRQIRSPNTYSISNEPQLDDSKVPGGAIMSISSSGAGPNPNYGLHIAKPNRPGAGGIIPINYGSSLNLYEPLIYPNQAYQQQQQYYWLNNNYKGNNGWQRPNTNNYYNQYYNRYEPGNQGWYLTGGDYWYNKDNLSLRIHVYS